MTDHDKAPHEELLARLENHCDIPAYAWADNQAANEFVTAMGEAAAAIRDLQAKLEAECKAREEIERGYADMCLGFDKEIDARKATEQALAKRDEILRRWLKHTTESAGMTPAIVHDKAAFQKFLDDIDSSEAQLIEDTNRALPQEPASAQTQPKP